jgi:hypothetical protein
MTQPTFNTLDDSYFIRSPQQANPWDTNAPNGFFFSFPICYVVVKAIKGFIEHVS